MSLKFGITGHTGSLGKTLLLSNKKINYSYFREDIRDKKAVLKWILKNNLDAVIHLAAIVPIKVVNKDKKKAYEVNFNGTKNIVDSILVSNVRWLFFSSTSHVYKSSKYKLSENSKIKPISYYGRTKLLGEKYIIKKYKKTEVNYSIGRIFSTANNNQKKNYLVPDLKRKIKKTKKLVTLENLNHYRDFISMKDISKIIFTLYRKKFNGIINIGTGKSVLLKDIARIICKKYKKKSKMVDNKKITYLVADIKKLKNLYKHKIEMKIENLIF